MPLATSSVAAVNRDTAFVSHAHPEDNTFALWLTLRLGEMGFKVWCDLTKLIGGETFWDNAEDAIRNSAAKFLYVLSRTSNTKIVCGASSNWRMCWPRTNRWRTSSYRYGSTTCVSKTRPSNSSVS
jgi:TIR domain